MSLPDALAKTPTPPYYAVVFTSRRRAVDASGYQKTAEKMIALASQQPGYLGVESVRDADGIGITVSYWRDRESIQRWREVSDHRAAQEQGRSDWYAEYYVRICRVEDDYTFCASSESA